MNNSKYVKLSAITYAVIHPATDGDYLYQLALNDDIVQYEIPMEEDPCGNGYELVIGLNDVGCPIIDTGVELLPELDRWVADNAPQLELVIYNNNYHRYCTKSEIKTDFLKWAQGASWHRPVNQPEPKWLWDVREDFMGS